MESNNVFYIVGALFVVAPYDQLRIFKICYNKAVALKYLETVKASYDFETARTWRPVVRTYLTVIAIEDIDAYLDSFEEAFEKDNWDAAGKQYEECYWTDGDLDGRCAITVKRYQVNGDELIEVKD